MHVNTLNVFYRQNHNFGMIDYTLLNAHICFLKTDMDFKILCILCLGILDQSAVWVDELSYYDMRTDRNKGISPLSLRPANPLGIEIDK